MAVILFWLWLTWTGPLMQRNGAREAAASAQRADGDGPITLPRTPHHEPGGDAHSGWRRSSGGIPEKHRVLERIEGRHRVKPHFMPALGGYDPRVPLNDGAAPAWVVIEEGGPCVVWNRVGTGEGPRVHSLNPASGRLEHASHGSAASTAPLRSHRRPRTSRRQLRSLLISWI